MKNTGARIRSYKLSAFLLTADNCLRKLVNTNIFRRKKNRTTTGKKYWKCKNKYGSICRGRVSGTPV